MNKKMRNKIKEILTTSFDYPRNIKIEFIENSKTKLTFKKDGKVVTEVHDNILDKIAAIPSVEQSEPQPE